MVFVRPRAPLNMRGCRFPGGGRFVLTNKGKYGLKAMVHLAELPPGA
jgi:hypothetical protein